MYLIELTMRPSRILVRRGPSHRGARTYSKTTALTLRWRHLETRARARSLGRPISANGLIVQLRRGPRRGAHKDQPLALLWTGAGRPPSLLFFQQTLVSCLRFHGQLP